MTKLGLVSILHDNDCASIRNMIFTQLKREAEHEDLGDVIVNIVNIKL